MTSSNGDVGCQGTLILHASGDVECMDDVDCALGREGHDVVVSCAQVEPPCGCSGTAPGDG